MFLNRLSRFFPVSVFASRKRPVTPALAAGLIGGVVASAALAGLDAASPHAVFAAAPESLNALKARADKLYDEKSYALAIDAYQKWLATAPPTAPGRTTTAYRVAVALANARKWDAAIAATDAFLAKNRNDALWTARMQYQKGLLFAGQMPHYAYKVGGKLYRGNDYPKTELSEKPEQVYLYAEDQKTAPAALEAALVAYERVGALGTARRTAVASEEADLHFDAARLIGQTQGWGSAEDWLQAKQTDWAINVEQAFNPKWPVPKKVLFLYARLPRLKPADSHLATLASFKKALYVAAQRQAWARRDTKSPYKIVQTIPYYTLDARAILDNAVRAHPQDEQAPQMRLIAAQWTASTGDADGALARYDTIALVYPASKWADDARQAAFNLRKKELNLATFGPLRAGQKAQITMYSKNLRNVTLRAYRVDLDQILLAPENLGDPHTNFTLFDRNFGKAEDAAKKGRLVAEWTVKTPDKNDFRPVSSYYPLPFTQTGAYVVVASGDDNRTRAATAVIISDLAVVKKQDRNGTLCFVVDAQTGRPVPGAKVVVKEMWDYNDKRKTVSFRGQADADGLFTAPHHAKTNEYDGNSNIEVFAYAPGERYALTNSNGWYGYDDSWNQGVVQGYAYTDRPVYRPKQTVYYRDVIARRTAGSADWKPVVGQKFSLYVNNPKGEKIHEATVTTGEFGSISGSFTLPNGAALGEYNLWVNGSENNVGGCQFRVEEYKKPEYEVSVKTTAAQARFGDTVSTTVKAAYYFGAPVAGAKVSYKVFRSPYYPFFHFPQPYDWFVTASNPDAYYPNRNAGEGELVTKGEGVTGADGTLKVSFKADAGTRGYQGDYAYTVKAEVIDSSRRTIEGEGVVKVARQGFYAFLDVKRGFYRPGDIAQFEVRTQDASENPVSVKGTLTVYKQTFDDKGGKTVETPVHTEEIVTDKEGRAMTTWRSDEAGQFVARFAALDKFEKEVKAQQVVWVASENMERSAFRSGGVTLLTDKTTFEEGETARVLIVSDQPNVWVLFTDESGGTIRTRRLIHVPGRALTVEVRISRVHVPNFALAAVAVRDYQFYSWQQELFVPPSRQFAAITVKGDKETYKPGETGTFTIQAKNANGTPARAEVSLAVFDSSVLYIQRDYAPDIRLFYYGQRRYINVNAESSQDFRLGGRVENDYPAPKFDPVGYRIPETGRLPGTEYVPSYYGYRDYIVSYDADNSLYAFNGDREFGRAGGAGGFGGGRSAPGGFDAPAPMADMLTAPMATTSAGRVRQSFAREVRSAPKEAQAQANAPARVRSNFADTAFWTPAVVTNADGTATVKFTFPDSLTTWAATARGSTANLAVGSGDTTAVTDKNLLVRLAAPRFFVERDRVTLSALVRNDLATAKRVTVSLGSSDTSVLAVNGNGPLTPNKGGTVGGEARPIQVALPSGSLVVGGGAGQSQIVEIPAGTEKRVDFTVAAMGAGMTTITARAESDEESDASETPLPVLAYGVQKFVTKSGMLAANQTTATVTINIPRDRKPNSAALLVQINPSLGATMLDALPYLADYPYGCVEQTMSRFLPSVLVAKTLRDSGVDLKTLQTRAEQIRNREAEGTPFGQKKETDGDTDQTGYTYPTGTPGVLKTPLLAEGLGHGERWSSPVFDEARLQAMTTEGMDRLVTMQRPDGGWGWWSDSAGSDPYMSAYVVYGLANARAAGVAVPDAVLARGFAYLEGDIKKRDDDRNLAVWEAYALSLKGGGMTVAARKIVDGIYAKRERLSSYGQALLALTLKSINQDERARVVCRNLQNAATIDRENGTASWRPINAYWWRWYNNDAETVAWVLRAYNAILPADPLNPMMVKWLVNHKKGNTWTSTKETAMVVYALNDYVRTNKELSATQTVTVSLGDKVTRTYAITPQNALLFDNQFLVPASLLNASDGKETVTITKQGAGRLYWSAAVQYITTEDKIKGSGQELTVARRYFKLTQTTKPRKDWEGGAAYETLAYDRAPIADGATLKSGDLIEVEMVLEAKNDYDYVIFEDMKPAGYEATELRSGASYGDSLYSNKELRDTKVAFFVDHLPQGRRVLRYRVRAETPGAFHALPTNAYAMYAPDVRALSDSETVTVGE